MSNEASQTALQKRIEKSESQSITHGERKILIQKMTGLFQSPGYSLRMVMEL